MTMDPNTSFVAANLHRLSCHRDACLAACPPNAHLIEGIKALCDGLREGGGARHVEESQKLGLPRPALIFHLKPTQGCLHRHHCARIGLIGNTFGYYLVARAAAASAQLDFVDARPECRQSMPQHALQMLPAVVPARQRRTRTDGQNPFLLAAAAVCAGAENKTLAHKSASWLRIASEARVELQAGHPARMQFSR